MKITMDRWNFVSRWGLKVGIVVIAGLWLSLIAASWADAAEEDLIAADRSPAAQGAAVGSATPASNSDDEYNFNWLDPEKKIYVLQNRRYLKSNRLMFSAMVGPGFSNPYRTTFNFDPRVTYHFSEAWGFELFYTLTTNSANSTFNALAGTNTNVLPVIREIHAQYGAALQWVPWYAKINVFNKILYFDWYFSGGVGGLHSSVYNSSPDGATINKNEVSQETFAMFFGTGHLYHLTDNLIVRLDFTTAVYNAQVYGASGGGTWYTNLNFGAGVGWRL